MGTMGREIVGPRVDEIIEMLNQGLAAEVNDAYRYLLLSKAASGVHSAPVAELFEATAQDEWGHVSLLMERVLQLGGQPLASPSEAARRSYVEYRPAPQDPTDVRSMVEDSLAGERAAITYYRDLFQRTREVDPVTAEIARQALIDEIDDEDEMERLLSGWPER
jgi:bacterioferritin